MASAGAARAPALRMAGKAFPGGLCRLVPQPAGQDTEEDAEQNVRGIVDVQIKPGKGDQYCENQSAGSDPAVVPKDGVEEAKDA